MDSALRVSQVDAYDASDRRTAKTIGGTTTSFLYDGLNAVQETQGGTVNPILTGLGIDERFARNEGATRSYFLTDALGSTVALADTGGSVIQKYQYDPYGNTTGTAGTTNPYQYTGRENDGLGLYYYRARYYSPGMGRFISEDPLGFGGGQSNFYAYVGGNPLSYIDRTGKGPVEAGIGFAVGFGFGLIDGLINHESGWDLVNHGLEDGAFGGLTGLTDGLNLVGKLAANAGINAAGEAFKEGVDQLETGCGHFSGTKIAFAATTGLFGDLGGKLVAGRLADTASGIAHSIMEASDPLEALVGGSISGSVGTVPTTIEAAAKNTK